MTTRGIMVRYTTKADRAEENEALIRAVFAELEAKSPPGIRYASFKLDDGRSFVHLGFIDTEDGSNPLGALGAFREFTAKIADRCEAPPVSTRFETVGSFGFPGSV